jgi:hypothetical protein
MPIISELTKQHGNAWYGTECDEMPYISEDNEWNSRHEALYVKEWIGPAKKERDWIAIGDLIAHDSLGICGLADEHLRGYYAASTEFAGFVYGHASKVIDARSRAEELRVEFEVLARVWQRDTKHLSQISQKITHFAFLRIIAMGYGAVPLILESLRDHPAHWFVALNAITQENPAPENASPLIARQAWLDWGHNEGLLN